MCHIGLLTTSRSDWGILRPVAAAIDAHDALSLHIIAAGTHLAPEHGHTVDQIHADGFEVAHRVAFLEADDTPEAIARAMGAGVARFAELFADWKPDLLLVLGDRFDMFPAVVAAAPMLIPIAHLHGGEGTLAAFDDQLRHATTKLAHIHLAATEAYAQRIRQMGERPEHVHVVGAPGLDDLLHLLPLSDQELADEFGFRPGQTNLLAVYHPETQTPEDVPRLTSEVFAALGQFDANIIIVRPNADTAHRAIHAAIDAFIADRPRAHAPVNVPRRAFLSLMRSASVMVGNSSSGIIEAPSFRTPVVNIGQRQAGRIQAANVLTVDTRTEAIRDAIAHALMPAFRAGLAELRSPYGDGQSSPRIARILASTPLGPSILLKGFVDQ